MHKQTHKGRRELNQSNGACHFATTLLLYCVDDFMPNIRGSTQKKTNADNEGLSDLARNENLIL